MNGCYWKCNASCRAFVLRQLAFGWASSIMIRRHFGARPLLHQPATPRHLDCSYMAVGLVHRLHPKGFPQEARKSICTLYALTGWSHARSSIPFCTSTCTENGAYIMTRKMKPCTFFSDSNDIRYRYQSRTSVTPLSADFDMACSCATLQIQTCPAKCSPLQACMNHVSEASDRAVVTDRSDPTFSPMHHLHLIVETCIRTS